MDQRLGESDALEHPFRVLAEPHRSPAIETDAFEQLGDQFFPLRAADAGERSVEVEHAFAGEIRRETVILRQVADGASRFWQAGILAEETRVAAGWVHGREQQLHERGLSGSIRAEQAERGAAG